MSINTRNPIIVMMQVRTRKQRPIQPIRCSQVIYKNGIVEKPALSIIAITKNEKDYVADWFDMLNNQTLKPLEIVVCDSSDDSTENIVKQRANIATFCEDCKFAEARNQTLQLATSDLILITDVDIRFPSNDFLEKSVNYFNKMGWKFAGIESVQQTDGTGITHFITGQFILARKDIVVNLGGFAKLFGVLDFWEDADLVSRASFIGVYRIPGTITHLRPQKIRWFVDRLFNPKVKG